MPAIEIKGFILGVSLVHDEATIQFEFMDGTKPPPLKLTMDRYAAIVATLQASPTSYYIIDTATGLFFISSSTEIGCPGVQVGKSRQQREGMRSQRPPAKPEA